MSNAAEKLETPQPYSTELAELNRVEAAMAELRAKHGTVPDYATKDGYEQGKASLRELTKYRTGTDKARLAITKPHRDFIDQVNQYAKSLIGEIEQLEGPHREAKREVDEAEQRKKEERIARLQERLAREVTSFLDTAAGLDSSSLADLIEAAESIDTEGYFDITKEAEDEKARVIRELSTQHAAALERERLAAEQAEIDAERLRLREEAEKREAEQRELEELRRFKAEQEAAKAQQPAEVMQSHSPSQGEPGYRQPIDTSRISLAAERYQPAIPAEDQAEVGELVGAHQAAASRWSQALEDLVDAGIELSAAEAALDAIANGDVRHVTFSQGDT